MAEQAHQQQAPAAGDRTERPRTVVIVVVAVLVPAAFVAGWRTRRGLGRLTGY